MDKRTALTMMAASAGAVLIPESASASPLWKEQITGCITRMKTEYRWDTIPEAMEAALVSALARKHVVGLDLERNIEVKFFDAEMKPWLGEDVETYVGTSCLITTSVRREGKKLVVERAGGEHSGVQHLNPGRMTMFKRALDLRFNNYYAKVVGPVDREKLDKTGFGDPGGYLVGRMEKRSALRAEALSSLWYYKVSIPVVTQRV
jgi:hypothetical protein